MSAFLSVTIAAGAVVAVMLMLVNSCADARRSYYAAMEQCISAGGTWVRSYGDSYGAICVMGRKL